MHKHFTLQIWRIKIARNFFFLLHSLSCICFSVWLLVFAEMGMFLGEQSCIVKMFARTHIRIHFQLICVPLAIRMQERRCRPLLMAMSDVLCYKCVKQEPHQKRMPFADVQGEALSFHKAVMCQCDDDTISQMLEDRRPTHQQHYLIVAKQVQLNVDCIFFLRPSFLSMQSDLHLFRSQNHKSQVL